MSDERFNPLRHLFNGLYVEQGELIIRTEKDDCPVISSSEGVRQGDVLGPLYFCLALKPAIDNAIARFSSVNPDIEPPQLFAYMDDVTIVGSENACTIAFALLKEELESISLMVNTKKTVATSETLAKTLDCKHSDCVKLLGAFVSRAMEKERAQIDSLPEAHIPLFDRLPLLPAEVAYRLLISCGVPRWAHLIRTHEPEVVKPASKKFTELSTRCLANILKVDYHQIDELTFRQICLPIRHGGLGLNDWFELADAAYGASLNNERPRDREEDQFAPPPSQGDDTSIDVVWEDTLTVLKNEEPNFAAHLKRNATKIASRWLVGPITFASCQPSNAFRAAVLFRLRWAGAHPDEPTPFYCRCGFPNVKVKETTTRDMVMHLVGCPQNGGPTKRHHMLRDALAGIMTRAGFSVQTEVNLDPKGELRMDIVATPSNGQTLYLDTTIANSTSRTLRNKTDIEIFAKKDAEKTLKYQAAAAAKGAKYCTIAVDIYGKMCQQTRIFINALAASIKSRADIASQASITVAATILPLSQALAFGNGTCLLNSQQLRQLGVNLAAVPVPLVAAPIVIEKPEPADVSAESEFFAPPVDTEPPEVEAVDDDASVSEAVGESDNATTPAEQPPQQPEQQSHLEPHPQPEPQSGPKLARLSMKVNMLTSPQQGHPSSAASRQLTPQELMAQLARR